MIRLAEDPRAAEEEWADEAAPELVALAELAALDPEATRAERWSVAAPAEVLLDPAGQLDLLAELVAGGVWPLRVAEPESHEERVARSLERLELGTFDALAPYRADEAGDDDLVPEGGAIP